MSNWSDPEPTMVAGPYGAAGPAGPPGPPPPVPPWPSGPPQARRSGPNLGLIVGILLLLVGAIAGGALLLTSDDDDGGSERAANRERRQEQEDVPCGLGQQTPGPAMAPCVEPPEAPDIPDVPDVPEMPDIPELPEPPDIPEPPEIPDLPEVPDVPTDAASSGDVVIALADSIYMGTPESIDEGTSLCMAEVITSVVGVDAVASAGGDYWALWGSTTGDEDAAISSGIFSTCTTAEQDEDLRADANWPASWGPG
jgi:hypothetical protein